MTNRFYSEHYKKSSAEEKNDKLCALNIRKQKFNTAKALNVLFELLNGGNLPKETDLSSFALDYLKGDIDPAYEVGQTKDLQKKIQALYKFMSQETNNNYKQVKQSPFYKNFIGPLSASMAWETLDVEYNLSSSDNNAINEALNQYFARNSSCPIGIKLNEILNAQFELKTSPNGSFVLEKLKQLDPEQQLELKNAAIAMRGNLQANLEKNLRQNEK